ncbi:MAG: YicC family protein [Firmicutes bacterium]|nr:YicC family protein [Bacillota bacterium]
MNRSLKSMTGFAQAAAETNGCAIRLRLRSVNHRFLDLQVRLPEGFESLEPAIRQRVRERLRRGHVDVVLQCEPAGPSAVRINAELAAAYLQAAEELRRRFQLASEPDLGDVLRLPGVVSAVGLSSFESLESLAAPVLACLEDALSRLDEMRAAEGRILAEEMRQRLEQIAACVARIEPLAAELRTAYAQRLTERLQERLAGLPLDPARVVQETALLAERSDIAEELARLRSHLRQLEQLLEQAGEVGKQLDFLLQEMQRETNTLLAKTPGLEPPGLAITELALEIKSQIEKLREQAQNIE